MLAMPTTESVIPRIPQIVASFLLTKVVIIVFPLRTRSEKRFGKLRTLTQGEVGTSLPHENLHSCLNLRNVERTRTPICHYVELVLATCKIGKTGTELDVPLKSLDRNTNGAIVVSCDPERATEYALCATSHGELLQLFKIETESFISVK